MEKRGTSHVLRTREGFLEKRGVLRRVLGKSSWLSGRGWGGDGVGALRQKPAKVFFVLLATVPV